MRVDELYDQASAATRRLVRDLLEQDAADRAWAGQVGPALTHLSFAEVIGAFNLESDETEAYESEDMHLLTAFASQAAVAIRNASASGSVASQAFPMAVAWSGRSCPFTGS